MISASEVKLVNFFVFNPKYGQSEGEEWRKIMFYYPKETDKDTQLKNAGLCEALIKFTESFKPDKPCHNFHTEKAKQFLFEAERDFWLVMTVGVPIGGISSENDINEDCSNLIQDNVFEAVLRRSYKTFKIFCGTFRLMLESSESKSGGDGINCLKEKLENFYSNYLSELNLANCDILDVFQGISFLPLGKEPFLHVQSFINLVETKFKPVKYSAFLYNDQLIWSGINSEDTQIIYRYLIFTLLPSYLDLDFQGSPMHRKNSAVYNHGSFVTIPSNGKELVGINGKISKVYLTNNGDDVENFHLVIYQVLNATLCLFIKERDSITSEFFKNVDSHLGPYLTELVSEVSEHCSRYSSVTTSNEGKLKVLYFNKLNLAQKTTMHVQSRKSVTTTIPNDILRMISELNAEKSKLNAFGEVMCLTLNDCWLVGRYSNSREFYVIFTQKKGNLIDVSDEVKKLCDTELKGIFFPE